LEEKQEISKILADFIS